VKPTWLYCNYDILNTLDEFRTGPGPLFGRVELVKKHAGGKYSGGKDLKKSQHYPRDFGVAVRKLHLKHESRIRSNMAALRRACMTTQNALAPKADSWDDAQLESLIGRLAA